MGGGEKYPILSSHAEIIVTSHRDGNCPCWLLGSPLISSPVEMEPQGLPRAEGDYEMLGLLVPSPQSEAVTHELEELTLQPSSNLPPLNERKNGEWGGETSTHYGDRQIDCCFWF